MSSPMLVVISLLSKSFPAFLALVRLLTSMYPYMVDKVPGFVKFPLTVSVPADEVPEHPACLRISFISHLMLVVLERSHVGLLDAVVGGRGGRPHLVFFF